MGVIEHFVTYGMDSYSKAMLYDKLPFFLLIFAAIFLILMVLIFAWLKVDNVALVSAPSFLIALTSAWFIVRSITPWGVKFNVVVTSAIMPILGVTLVVIMVAQILRFLG